jgi:cation transport ATPase
MKNLLFFFLFIVLLSTDTKAAVLPISTLSDTCVEINLKSGTLIIAKITKKTTEKVYFKKCDDLSDKTEYFVLQEKIDNIKAPEKDVKKIQQEKSTARAERQQKSEDKDKQTRIWVLLGVHLLSLLLLFGLSGSTGIAGLGIVAFLLLGVSGIWGLIEALTYKGKFEGKGFAIGYFATMNALLFLLLLLIIIIILSLG